jgi:hypothetical protein
MGMDVLGSQGAGCQEEGWDVLCPGPKKLI